MKKLLVTGVSGLLGWNICTAAKDEWNIVGTAFANPVHIDGVTIERINLTAFTAVKKIFQDFGPDAVIHAAAAASPDYCQMHVSETHKINVDAAVNIAGLCADRNIPLAFTSTDLVFDGLRGMYKEEDPISPVNVYGEQKVLAEQKVLEVYPNAAVCRMPLMLGLPSPAYTSSLQAMLRALRDGSELTLFTDEFRSPISADTATRGLFMSLEKVKGIIHLGGRDRISRYNLGMLIAEILECDPDNIIACRQRDLTFAAPRAADVSLDSSKAFGLGFNPPPLREELQRLIQQENCS